MGLSYESAMIQQTQTIGLLERAVENFKKIGSKNLTLAIAKARLLNVEKYWEKCMELNCQLLELVDDDVRKSEPYFTGCYFYEAEETYQGAADYITAVIDKLTPQVPGDVSPTHHSTMIDVHSNKSTVSLPRITLPKFSGNYTDWLNFRDIYESLIHKNTGLSNVERFHYLKSSLVGEAALAIKNVNISDANYPAVWETLNTRYNNSRAIVQAHLSSFFDISSLKSENASELKSLRDQTNDTIAALRNLDRPVDAWDDLLVFLTVRRLDNRSRMEWELKLGDAADFPSFQDLDSFLATRIRALESIRRNDHPVKTSSRTSNSSHPKQTRVLVATEKRDHCSLCPDEHQLYQCAVFKDLPVDKRAQHIRSGKRCLNCLRAGHAASNCRSKYRCARCKGMHHTLLHADRVDNSTQAINRPGSNLSPDAPSFSGNTVIQDAPYDCGPPFGQAAVNRAVPNPQSSTSCSATTNGRVYLATAKLLVTTSEGRSFPARALVDPGSESTFISHYAVQALRATKQKTHVEISGVGAQNQGLVRALTEVVIQPRDGAGTTLAVRALILPKLTSYKPTSQLTTSQWPHLAGLALADDDPSDNSPIDLLIGADIYGHMLLEGLRQGPLGSPTAQRTIFGWILTGPSIKSHALQTSVSSMHCMSTPGVDTLIRAFWEIEEIAAAPPLPDEDARCEQHFLSTHSREPDGRYIVRLPFKATPVQIGHSRNAALQLLIKSEARLSRLPVVQQKYQAFMREYRDLGHMEAVQPPMQSSSPSPVYLPHHPVFKSNDSSCKIRVVFNASQRTGDGSTLNDKLLSGPKLQSDLSAIILRWRRYRYVYTADIEKMFRQILVHPDDRDFQRILWRDSPSEPIAEFRLNTVTYGTSCAPYLALRVLKQLAHDERAQYPLAVDILTEDSYVDDLFFGADDTSTLGAMRNQLTALMHSGGFTLKKWAANDNSLLSNIPAVSTDPALLLSHDSEGSIKILGVSWHPITDSFRFAVNPPGDTKPTKRRVLSDLAKLFDPLGWVAPVIVTAKILMQELWLRKCDWDEAITPDLALRWSNYCHELTSLSNISIPRWTGQTNDAPCRVELHGFADASSRAYAAVVYVRVTPVGSIKNHPVVQ